MRDWVQGRGSGERQGDRQGRGLGLAQFGLWHLGLPPSPPVCSWRVEAAALLSSAFAPLPYEGRAPCTMSHAGP